MPLPTREFEDDQNLYAFGGRQLPSTLGESIGATISDPRLRPTQLLSEFQQQEPDTFHQAVLSAAPSPVVSAYGTAIEAYNAIFGPPPAPQDKELLTPEQIKQSYGYLGVSFDRPTPKSVVEATAQRRQDDMHREEIISSSPQGLVAKAARFGTGLLGAAIDPLNIASTFIPVMGEATVGRIAATSGVVAARAVSGAAAGAVGTLAVEPLTYGLSKQLQLDYSMSDAIFNVAFGGLIGAGLHVGVGAIADRAARAPYIKTQGGETAPAVHDIPLPETVTVASPEAREGAIRGAVAQTADGRAVDIAPIFQVDQGLTEARALREAPLTQDEQAQVLETHSQSITSLAEPKSDWILSEEPLIEPKPAYDLAAAQEFDAQVLNQIEQAVVEARGPVTVPGEQANVAPGVETVTKPQMETGVRVLPEMEQPTGKAEKELVSANENVTRSAAVEPAINQLALCLSRRG